MNIGLPMYYGAEPILFEYAKAMRVAPTRAERIMWQVLNAETYKIHNFRRQHPIASYIADFYSHSLKLVIEIDGSIHNLAEQKAYDGFRDEDMIAYGITVKRFTNRQVFENRKLVLEEITLVIQTLQTDI